MKLRPFKRLILCLLGISVIYIGAIRPLQSIMINHWVVPYFENRIPIDSDISIDGVSEDQFDLVTLFQSVKIELPFNGWYWLTLGLFITAGNKQWIKWMTLYHLALFLILFLGAHLIIAGLDWFSILFNVHEHIYKVLFLIVSLMGLKPVFMNHKIDG